MCFCIRRCQRYGALWTWTVWAQMSPEKPWARGSPTVLRFLSCEVKRMVTTLRRSEDKEFSSVRYRVQSVGQTSAVCVSVLSVCASVLSAVILPGDPAAALTTICCHRPMVHLQGPPFHQTVTDGRTASESSTVITCAFAEELQR